MPRKLLLVIVIILAMPLFFTVAAARESFVIGVAPHTSARVILEMYQPLRQQLEKSLGMPVEIVTTTDFKEFARRALSQDYDLVVTTGHQARLLQTDAGYLPLLTYKADFRAVAIVAAKGPVHKPKDLQGMNLLGLSPASLVTLWGQRWLADHGLGSAPIRYVSASDSVAQLVIAGEAAAAFISSANFNKLAPDVQRRLRIIAESRPMAGRVYVLNGRHTAEKRRINDALLTFAGTPEGRRYFESNKLGGYRGLLPKELDAMDSYAAEVRMAMRKGSQ